MCPQLYHNFVLNLVCQQSSECQKKHWNVHKASRTDDPSDSKSISELCNNCSVTDTLQEKTRALVADGESTPGLSLASHGLSAQAFSKALLAWSRHHRPILSWACTNAFDVKHHPTNSETHVFLVTVELTAKAENGEEQRPMKMFRVGDAKLVPKSEMATISPELHGMITAGDEQEKGTVSQDYDGVMFEVVRCRDHCKIMRYPWNKGNLINLVEDRQWKAVLKRET